MMRLDKDPPVAAGGTTAWVLLAEGSAEGAKDEQDTHGSSAD